MGNLNVLLLDYRRSFKAEESDTLFSSPWMIHRIPHIQQLPESVEQHKPAFVCFDFDYPDIEGLKAVRWVKNRFPYLPILMITLYHSEELAVWALRARVWDLLIKPVCPVLLSERLALLVRMKQFTDTREKRELLLFSNPIPAGFRIYKRHQLTLPAITYIERNITEKIKVSDLARACSLPLHQFRDAFKIERGQSIREYLVQFRINKAAKMLENPNITVTEVAFAVGFNDLSRFTHLFKRYCGFLPSKFKYRASGAGKGIFKNT